MATAHLLGRIYDALLDEAALTALPQRIAGALGARSGVVQIFLTEGPPVLLTHHGFSEAMTQDYLAHFHRVDVWNA
ncbi:MAG TPA: hypothetical protein VEB20_07325, partial [Azospirillaceae bacterium]|nr:hypothetical protein [Azospirillaceae bacterium]